jgi:hypothetical protein
MSLAALTTSLLEAAAAADALALRLTGVGKGGGAELDKALADLVKRGLTPDLIRELRKRLLS